jgi:Tfp pilus assembly protein PilN
VSEFDLNLSTQPFPAYRLINMALVLMLVVLAGVSVWQGVGFVRYSDRARSIRTAEQDNRVEAEALGKRVAELESRLDRPESTAKLSEISFLNHLILRKSLSWTRLFAVLEELVPNNVRFTNLTPDVGAHGEIMLRLGARARTIADVKEFLKRLENSPLFENVMYQVEQKSEPTADSRSSPRINAEIDPEQSTDIDVTLSAVYYPQRETR